MNSTRVYAKFNNIPRNQENTKFIDQYFAEMAKRNLRQPFSQYAYLANLFHESNYFKILKESLGYTAPRLLQVFPTRVKNLSTAQSIVARGQVAIGDVVYGGRMGNNTNGDGYRYRGNGRLQLTGKDNHRACGQAIGVDLVGKPELVQQADIDLKVCLWFFDVNRLDHHHASSDFIALCKGISTGNPTGKTLPNGYADRAITYHQILEAFGLKE